MRTVIHPDAQSESLDLDQPGTSSLQKSPVITNSPEVEVAEADYVPGQEVVNTDTG